MATKAPSKKPSKVKAEKASPSIKAKAVYPVDNNYILKRFQKHLAKSIFAGDEAYGDYLKLKKKLHENVTDFSQLLSFSTELGEGDNAKVVELNTEILLESLQSFFNDFAKAA